MKKHIAISGSTGFIGSTMFKYFTSLGMDVTRITRYDLYENIEQLKIKISNADVIINFAGYPIFNKWNNRNRTKILDSRVRSTHAIVSILNKHFKGKHLINTSAIDIYDKNSQHDETSSHYGNDFLADVVKKWEIEATQLVNNKLTLIRFGVVLGRDGGAFPSILLPAKLGVGIIPGKGTQYFSFIHIDDVKRSIKYLIDRNLTGIFNLTGPAPVTYKDFIQTIGNHQRLFIPFHVPSAIFKSILGSASTLLLDSRNVLPTNLMKEGYEFKFPDINLALDNLL